MSNSSSPRGLPREDFRRVLDRRFSRRNAVKAAAVGLGLGALAPTAAAGRPRSSSTLTFPEVPHGLDEHLHVSADHRVQTLIRWGDAVLPGAPPLNVAVPDPEGLAMQFGYDNDFVAFVPLPAGSSNSSRGLLAVNHEHCAAAHMWARPGAVTPHQLARAELATLGMSVIEVARIDGRWIVDTSSAYSRRITGDSPLRLSGPAAGHPRLRTGADPDGVHVFGTLNNCAGGTTPWQTVLSGEENIQQAFGGRLAEDSSEAQNHRRMGLGRPFYNWAPSMARFDLGREPNEPNRFGWVTEVDPYDPEALPVKRTALGRFKHEGATCVEDESGRLVVYQGDDQAGECLYRFVSDGLVDHEVRSNNADLLDRGVLSVARFESDGTLRWLPLVHGEGPLTARNGFHSQADVLIETRRAAELLGGTPLDRPEDVETNPTSGLVYVALTKNAGRGGDGRQRVDAVNPRANNRAGHVVELIPPGAAGARRHAADAFRWEIFLLAGDPRGDSGANAHPETSVDGWLACPDNLMFDRLGRLWIATDGMHGFGVGDGLYACDTDGAGRALTRQFMRVPRGAEVCGPCFTPDDRTLFAAVKHPGIEKGATFASPTTRWPDFRKDLPPRPALVVVEREDGGVIG